MDQPRTLSTVNQATFEGLTSAIAALVHLNDQGLTVTRIQLDGRRPRITVHMPMFPPGRFLYGVPRMRVRQGDAYRCVMSASVHGCQVEWIEQRSLEVVRASR